ncbi:MAG: HIT family protein [Parvularculaceae bacterium]|nr:HIT family protein [Parvularculaceae bacterium]
MSLDTAYDPDNIFARIIRGELPAISVYDDDDALAFMDIFPQTRGHTLVIPKKARATNFFDADVADLSVLIARVQHVARGVRKALKPDGVRLAQFNGAAAGQTVFHLHFHIIPVFESEGLKRHAGEKADMAELEALAGRIRAALG